MKTKAQKEFLAKLSSITISGKGPKATVVPGDIEIKDQWSGAAAKAKAAEVGAPHPETIKTATEFTINMGAIKRRIRGERAHAE